MSGSIYGVGGSELCIKQGATFSLLLALQNDDGTPYDISTLTITSGLRIGPTLVTIMTAAPTGVAGQLAITAASDTWPVGHLTGDFRIVSTGDPAVLYSATYTVTVVAAMTPAS
jgi:hypothetical protein